jgi:hypothetical protein
MIDSQLANRTPKEQLEYDLKKSMRESSKRHQEWLDHRAQEKAMRESMQSF